MHVHSYTYLVIARRIVAHLYLQTAHGHRSSHMLLAWANNQTTAHTMKYANDFLNKSTLGILGSDLVAFQCDDYLLNFLGQNSNILINNDFLKLQMKWKLIHLPLVCWLTHWLICPHNALVSYLKLVPGFQAYFSSVNCFLSCEYFLRQILTKHHCIL